MNAPPDVNNQKAVNSNLLRNLLLFRMITVSGSQVNLIPIRQNEKLGLVSCLS